MSSWIVCRCGTQVNINEPHAFVIGADRLDEIARKAAAAVAAGTSVEDIVHTAVMLGGDWIVQCPNCNRIARGREGTLLATFVEDAASPGEQPV